MRLNDMLKMWTSSRLDDWYNWGSLCDPPGGGGGYYSVVKMNTQKCKLNFIFLNTNLAISYTNLIGITNHIDNQFNLNFQLISLHVLNSFII